MVLDLKKHQKKFGTDLTKFGLSKMAIKKSNLHYMSFFQSCSILTCYSLKWPSQWVGSENIYVGGYLIYCLGDIASDRSQNGSQGQSGPFGPYQRRYHPNGISNTPNHIYFLNPLIETVILSYKTLKSNNFEKMTYNANLLFSNGLRGSKFNFWAPICLHDFLGKCVDVLTF